MNTLAKTEDVAALSAERRDLIKRTVAKDATDDELQMFYHVAEVSGLDPLLKQIHFTKMGGRLAFIADVNGLQARASRSPDYEGIDCATVFAKDDFLMDQKTGEVVKHVNNPFAEVGAPVGAWAVVHRKGMRPFVSCVRFNEYFNPANALWKTKPAVMILKCAKSTALRLAYPERFSGVYDEAELGKEEVEVNPPPPATPQAAHAAAVKQQLRASFKLVDVQAGETEEEAKARHEKAAEAPKEPTPYECAWMLLNEYDYAPEKEKRHALLKDVTGKTKPAELTKADVLLLQDALEAARVGTAADEQGDIPF